LNEDAETDSRENLSANRVKMRRIAIVVGLLASLFLPLAVRADVDPAPPEEPLLSRVERAVKKAVVFEAASSVLETAIFAGIYGSSAASLPAVFALTLASSSAVYIVHELSWGHALKGTASTEDDPDVMAAKAATFRVANIARGFVIGGVAGSGDMVASTAFAVLVAAADTVLYLSNEILFSVMGRGPAPEPVQDQSIPVAVTLGE